MGSSPSDSQNSVAQPEENPIADIPAPQVLGDLGNNANQHYIQPKVDGIQQFSRKSRKATKSSLQPYQGWEQPPEPNREPYHQYVHELVEAGWDSLRFLDDYMGTDVEDQELVISVLDITEGNQRRPWPDIHDYAVLKTFLNEQGREGAKVRLYMAEQKGPLSAGVMEAFGSSLNLDPRFFQWSIKGNKHVLEPSARHRAPFTSIGFGVPKLSTPLVTDAERFKVTIYVKHDSVGQGWTGTYNYRSRSLQRSSLIAPRRAPLQFPHKVATLLSEFDRPTHFRGPSSHISSTLAQVIPRALPRNIRLPRSRLRKCIPLLRNLVSPPSQLLLLGQSHNEYPRGRPSYQRSL